MPLDSEGAVALQSGSGLWRGALLDPVDQLKTGARVRVVLESDPDGSEGGALLWVELDATRTVQGRDGLQRRAWSSEVLQVRRDQKRQTAVQVIPDALPAGIPGGVEVVIVGHGGKLEIRHQGVRYTAWAMRVPTRLSVGQELHLRVVLPMPNKPNVTESVDVLGCVLRVDGEGRMPVVDGGRFELGITRHLGTALPFPVVEAEELRRRVDGWQHEIQSVPPTPVDVPALAERASSNNPSTTPRVAGGLDAPSGLVGNLQFLSMIEILQSLALGQKTAHVELSDGARSGSVYLREGRLVAVFDADLAGEEAFYSLASWDRGAFRVHFGRSTPAENVHHSLTFLVLEHMRRMDEASHRPVTAPLSDSLAGVFSERDDATDVSPVPEPGSVEDELDIEVLEMDPDEVIIDDGTPVEPLRPQRALPDVTQVTPPPQPNSSPVFLASEVDPFASFFAEAAQQRARAMERPAVAPPPRSQSPALEDLFEPDEGSHPVFSGHSNSNPSPVH